MESEAGRTGREERAKALRLQREVLAFVIVEQPLTLSYDEIVRAMGPDPAVAAAIEELIAAGLLRRQEEEVLATPAAQRLHLLEPLEPPTDVP